MPQHIETHEIRVFKAVYENQGFKRAADKLFVTQSAVSQTIANLERKLETTLLERSPLKLTETGIRLLHYAEAVLGEEAQVWRDISNIKNGILGNLLLATSSTVNLLFGEALITAFLNDSPMTRLKINVMPSRQINPGVEADLWELALGPFQQTMPDQFKTVPLFADTRKLVVSKRHPLANEIIGAPVRALAEIPLVVSHLESPDVRPSIEKLRDTFGTIWEVNDLSLRIDLIRSGRAMGFMDSMVMDSDPRCESFQNVDGFAFSEIPLTFGLIYREAKPLSGGAARFIDLCADFDFSRVNAL